MASRSLRKQANRMVGKVIGVDFGTTGIKLAEVKTTKDAVTVEKQAYLPLDPKVIVEGRIDSSKVTAVAAQLKALLASEKFTTKDAIMGVNSINDVFVNRAITNWHDPKEYSAAILNDMIAEKGLLKSAPEEGVIVNPVVYQEIPGAEEGQRKLDVLLCGVNESIVVDQAEVLKKAGLTVVGCDLAALASLRATRTAERDSGNFDVLVDVGHDVMSVLIHESGRPYAITLQGNRAGAEASDLISLAIDEEDMAAIEREKVHLSVATDARIQAALTDYNVRAAEAIFNVIYKYATSQAVRPAFAGLTLIGGGALLAGLSDSIEDRFDFPVRLGEYDPAIGGTPVKYHLEDLVSVDFTVATGLGMGARV